MFQIDLASDLELHIARLSGELDLAGSAELVAVLTAADGKPVIADYGTSRLSTVLALGRSSSRNSRSRREVVDSRCAERRGRFAGSSH